MHVVEGGHAAVGEGVDQQLGMRLLRMLRPSRRRRRRRRRGGGERRAQNGHDDFADGGGGRGGTQHVSQLASDQQDARLGEQGLVGGHVLGNVGVAGAHPAGEQDQSRRRTSARCRPRRLIRRRRRRRVEVDVGRQAGHEGQGAAFRGGRRRGSIGRHLGSLFDRKVEDAARGMPQVVGRLDRVPSREESSGRLVLFLQGPPRLWNSSAYRVASRAWHSFESFGGTDLG
ncbi:hypothetical protein VTK73DRAFT_4191 [Phialemonium thermophilum]|uniref:Uncharacterized protein n=1 Tax=Phialemonium thermophilum TaxID=223376 RepID=A0ABR3VB42_9PEZI